MCGLTEPRPHILRLAPAIAPWGSTICERENPELNARSRIWALNLLANILKTHELLKCLIKSTFTREYLLFPPHHGAHCETWILSMVCWSTRSIPPWWVMLLILFFNTSKQSLSSITEDRVRRSERAEFMSWAGAEPAAIYTDDIWRREQVALVNSEFLFLYLSTLRLGLDVCASPSTQLPG